MSLKTTAPAQQKTNGTVKQLSQPSETPTSKTEPRQPEQKPVQTPGNDLQPLEDRLHRLNVLFDLQSKHNRLAKSQQKLAEFKMKKGSENIVLTIEDEENHSVEAFTTSNPDVIKAVLDCLQTTIIAKRKEVEAQLVL